MLLAYIGVTRTYIEVCEMIEHPRCYFFIVFWTGKISENNFKFVLSTLIPVAKGLLYEANVVGLSNKVNTNGF